MKIFLDCGSHFGEGFAQFHKKLGITPDWGCYMFEPNKVCAKQLREQHIPWWSREMNIGITLLERIVWNSNDLGMFMTTTEHAAGGRNCGVGSTAMARADWDVPNASEDYMVQRIDFCQFVKNLPKTAEVFCKMDIEGSEYNVIESLIDTGAIDRIQEIWIEWHARMYVDKKPIQKKQKSLLAKLDRRGVKHHKWT